MGPTYQQNHGKLSTVKILQLSCSHSASYWKSSCPVRQYSFSTIMCPWFDFSFPPQCPQVVPLRGDWAIISQAGSGRVCRVWPPRERSLEIIRRGWEWHPGHWEDRQWNVFIPSLSCHAWHEMNARCLSLFQLYHSNKGAGRAGLA